MSDDPWARLVMERCDTLASFSEEPERLTRRYGSAALRQVYSVLDEWMRAAEP
jgi:allantoate deiminase